MYSHTSHHASLPTLEESDTLSRLGGLSIVEQSHLLEQPTKKLKTELSPESSEKLQIDSVCVIMFEQIFIFFTNCTA